MSEANAEDGPFGLGRSKMLKCQRHNIEIEFVFCFFVRPEFRQKKTDGASGGFLPRPLLLRLRNPNQSRFCGNHSPRKMLPQNRVRIVPPPARILGGQNTKKNVLYTFKRNFTPAKSRKQGTFFFGVAE
jgi:hypothetical protein